jgi:Ribonuclease G/E
MKGRALVLGRLRGRDAAALVVDGVLEDLLVAPPDDRPPPETIFRALPDRPVKGMGGVFLRLPEGTAFLRTTRGVSPGRPLLVQVSGYADAGKAVPVTNRVALKGRHVVVTLGAPGRNVSRQVRDAAARQRLESLAADVELPEGAGLIMRSEAAHADGEALVAELGALADLAARMACDVSGPAERLFDGPGPHEIALRDWGRSDDVQDGAAALAENGVEEAVDALLRPVVALAGGGSLSIEPTRALVAVDVDTGRDTSPAAALKANIAAARVLPRELRCRGLGGQVVVDFAPIPRRDRQRVEQALTAALRQDPVETAIVGWTPLSHLEVRRRRVRLPLTECLR